MKKLIEYLEDHYPDDCFYLPNGLGDAFIGVVWAEGEHKAVYDKHKVIELLSETMPYYEAVEYFHYNIESVGEHYPLYMENYEEDFYSEQAGLRTPLEREE